MSNLYPIKTDYPVLANAKAAALTLVNAHWGFCVRHQNALRDEPDYKRRVRPNAQGIYPVTATTTYSTHPWHAGVRLERSSRK